MPDSFKGHVFSTGEIKVSGIATKGENDDDTPWYDYDYNELLFKDTQGREADIKLLYALLIKTEGLEDFLHEATVVHISKNVFEVEEPEITDISQDINLFGGTEYREVA